MSRRRKLLIGLVLLVLSLGSVVVGYAIYEGGQLTARATRTVEVPPDFTVERVAIPSKSGSLLAGWFVELDRPRGNILLLHGMRSDRGDMVGLMQFFYATGFNVLAIDMQAHGESAGDRITLGYLESRDAAAAVDYLWKRYPDGPVFVLGRSLGGAAAVMATYEKPPTAMIVEATFSDIETAIGNRLKIYLGEWGRVFTPLLSWQIRPRLGVSADSISPERAMQNVRSPVLIIYGSDDLHCRPEEAQRLIAAAQGPVESYEVEGANHNTINRVSPEKYLQRLLDFLEPFTTNVASATGS